MDSKEGEEYGRIVVGQRQESSVPMGRSLVRHLALRVPYFCSLLQGKILNYSSVGFKSSYSSHRGTVLATHTVEYLSPDLPLGGRTVVQKQIEYTYQIVLHCVMHLSAPQGKFVLLMYHNVYDHTMLLNYTTVLFQTIDYKKIVTRNLQNKLVPCPNKKDHTEGIESHYKQL